MLAESKMVSPCPFSKGYKVPIEQAWFLLKSFYAYRLILACLLLAIYYLQLGGLLIDSAHEQLYLVVCAIYLLVTLVGWGFLLMRAVNYAAQAQIFVFTDILLLTLIMHACGGISSGVGALMLVSTAAGGLLIGGRCAMLFAAIASLFIFAEQAYAYRMGDFNSTYYPYSGMLGAGFFTLAMLSHILAKRTERTELISSQQQELIISLEELNQYIIQNMQSGIIISDQQQMITSYNEACPRLLGLSSLPEQLSEISSELAKAFEQWLDKKVHAEFVSIPVPEQGSLYVNFTSLPTQHALFFMITLEDMALYNQRVQQSKLASLGLLTANIAHEIRNPLGAISHAGQLLAECPDLSPQDLRLTEIIQAHALRVNSIVEDILQLSRRNHSKQELIELESWLNAFLVTFEAEDRGHQYQFRVSVEQGVPDGVFDPGHLTQILTNLCANALKYSYVSNKKIVLKVSTSFHRPCIDVIDFGESISDTLKRRLFEPFFTTSKSGTGLGLYISRELAELNQAVLSYHILDSGQGNCFRLCLTHSEQKKIKL